MPDKKKYYRVIAGPFIDFGCGELVSEEPDGRIKLQMSIFGRMTNIIFEASQIVEVGEEEFALWKSS